MVGLICLIYCLDLIIGYYFVLLLLMFQGLVVLRMLCYVAFWFFGWNVSFVLFSCLLDLFS